MFKTVLAALLLVACPLAAGAANPRTVSITLQDASADASMTGMVIRAEPAKVKAGRVTLEAVNLSKDLVHEVLVVRKPPEGQELPYDAKRNLVIERKAHSLGEISDLKPGAHGKLTLNLHPGTYLLFCNQAGHYKAGMSTTLVAEN